MKTPILLALGATLMFASVAHAQNRGINCYKRSTSKCADSKAFALPTSVDEFLRRRSTLGRTPWGGATLAVHALLVRQRDKALGNKLVVLSIAEKRLRRTSRGVSFKGFGLGPMDRETLRRSDRKPYCVRSLTKGSSPANGYKLDPSKVRIRFNKVMAHSGSIKSGRFRVFVCSTGADTCKPLWMNRNPKGIWKADEIAFIVGGCRPPARRNPAVDAL